MQERNGGGGQGQETSGRGGGGIGGSGPGGARRSGSGLFNLREMGDLLNNSQVKRRDLKENMATMLTLLTLSKILFAISLCIDNRDFSNGGKYRG